MGLVQSAEAGSSADEPHGVSGRMSLVARPPARKVKREQGRIQSLSLFFFFILFPSSLSLFPFTHTHIHIH